MSKLKVISKFAIIMAYCIWAGISISNAQGFSAMVEKLSNLEKRLVVLESSNNSEKQEAGQLSGFQDRLTRLESKVNKNDSNQDDEFIKNSIVELTLKVNDLESRFKDASFTDADGNSNLELAAEVRSIINDLKASIESRENGNADTDDGFISLSNIEFSGFFDLIYKAPDDADADKGFAINQMELDVESSYSPFLSISGAFAYDGEAIGVGAVFADLHWMGEASSHPVQSTTFDHSGIVIGQFDVPFGADFERIASPDRSLFSVPLAVEHTVDSWNDMGLIVYGGQNLWESQLYFVNGDQDNMAYGGRVSLNITDFARVGGSMASIMDGDDKQVSSLIGGDLVAEYESFALIGEYIIKQDSKTTNQVDISGYYGELSFSLKEALHKDIYLVGGYSAVEYKDVESSVVTSKLNSTTFGAGFNLNDNASIRLEHRIDDGDTEKQSSSIGQFVISF